MPLDVFTDTPLVSITGAVTIGKDPKDGTNGTLAVAGAASFASAVTATGSLIASSNLSVTGSLIAGTFTGSITAASSLAVASGLSIAAGGETITAGGLSITAGGATVTAGGLLITAGGETIASGGLSIAAGGETITAGGLSITAGGATVTGGVTTDLLLGGSTSAIQTVADSGTIVITRRVAKVSGAAGATIAGAAIATAAASGGQELIVINENATVGSTLVISTGVIVKAGTTTVTVSGQSAARFIYDEVQTKWVNV